MAAGFLLLVLIVGIVGLVSGYWVEKHWESKETIRDSGSVHYVTDATDPDSYTEGNDRDTGILPAEGWGDRVTISDADGSLRIAKERAKGQQGTVMETVGHT